MQAYKKLFTYWYSLIIYDLTVEFCSRWVKSWKLREQMTGAARSGKQNIVEGKLPQWSKDDRRVLLFRGRAAKLVRDLSNLSSLGNLRESASWRIQKALSLPKDAEETANLLLTLCHQATYLLNRQVEALEKKHQTEGGYTEKLYRRRKAVLQRF